MKRASGPLAIASLLALASAGFAAHLVFAPINPDAGFYLPVARDLVRGKLLYADLKCDYPPLGPYALSLLGLRVLGRPEWVMGLVVALQICNAALLGALLLRRGHARSLCIAAGSLWLAWIWTCEGAAIVLEPLVNFGLLVSALAMTWPGVPSAIVAGLGLGLALATKQYALLAVPGLTVLFFAGPAKVFLIAQPSSAFRWVVLRALALVVAMLVPYLILCGLAHQRPDSLAMHLATFGGRDYGGLDPRNLLLAMTTGGPATPLVVVSILAGVAIFADPSVRRVGQLLLLAGTMAPLLVRDYPHYVQLAAPWAILILVDAAALFSVLLTGTIQASGRCLALLSLAWLPVGLAALGALVPLVRDRPRERQLQVAAAVQLRLRSGDRLLVVRDAWLRALIDAPAPDGDYRFVPRGGLDRQSASRREYPRWSDADLIVSIDQALLDGIHLEYGVLNDSDAPANNDSSGSHHLDLQRAELTLLDVSESRIYLYRNAETAPTKHVDRP